MDDLLVTGTDTGVGKTVVAAALVLALGARGRRAVGFKPVETGVPGAGSEDSEILARAGAGDEPLARPCLRLEEPLAPAVAAERAGIPVDPRAFEARVRELSGRGYAVVVEGAGGALVPLAWGYTILDLAAGLDLPAVVVARTGLGTLNHVLLTVRALAERAVKLRGIVLNGLGEAPDLAERTNPDALRRLLPGARIVVLPRQATADPFRAATRSAGLLAPLLDP